MMRSSLSLSATFVLALACASPAGAQRVRLPRPRAPTNSIFSPAAIAGNLRQRGYRIEAMRRQGTAYSVTATGSRGNRVQMLIDGRSGEVIGLSVPRAAPNAGAAVAQILRGPPQARFSDEQHPFGVVVPDRYARGWTVIPVTALAPSARTDRYVRAADTGIGYRWAVPARSVRPGRGGSRSTIPPSRMQRPLFQVYEADGTLMQMAADAEDRATLAAMEAEEARSAADDLALENAYLQGALDGADLDEPSDYNLDDGDLTFNDDPGDDYSGGITEDSYDDYPAEVMEEENYESGHNTGDEQDEPSGHNTGDEPDEPSGHNTGDEPDEPSGHNTGDEPNDPGMSADPGPDQPDEPDTPDEPQDDPQPDDDPQ